jgi:hypothetical protein
MPQNRVQHMGLYLAIVASQDHKTDEDNNTTPNFEKQ